MYDFPKIFPGGRVDSISGWILEGPIYCSLQCTGIKWGWMTFQKYFQTDSGCYFWLRRGGLSDPKWNNILDCCLSERPFVIHKRHSTLAQTLRRNIRKTWVLCNVMGNPLSSYEKKLLTINVEDFCWLFDLKLLISGQPVVQLAERRKHE